MEVLSCISKLPRICYTDIILYTALLQKVFGNYENSKISFTPVHQGKPDGCRARPGYTGKNLELIVAHEYSCRMNLPSISNFAEIVAPFAKQHCLLHIDNFYQISGQQISYPGFLRKPELVYYLKPWDKTGYGRGDYIFAWSLATVGQNASVELDLITQDVMPYNVFPTSAEIERASAILNPINISQHAVRAKPWNCQVHLLIFPPIKYPLPPTMWYPSAAENLATQFPSLVPKFTILFFDQEISEAELQTVFVNAASSDWSRFHQIFLTANVKSMQLHGLVPPAAIIKDIHFIQVCSMCVASIFPQGEKTQVIWKRRINLSQSWAFKEFESMGFPDSAAGVYLLLEPPYPPEGFMRSLLECREYNSFSLLTKPTYLTHSERYAQARGHVIQCILRNYSIQQERNSHCLNARVRQQIWNPVIRKVATLFLAVRLRRETLLNNRISRGIPAPMVSVENTLDALRFVSCGKRGLRPFAFGELINVFDKYVWLCITALYMVLLPLAFLAYQQQTREQKHNSGRYLLAGWKTLLEQGDGILSKCRSSWLKVASAIFILMGVVLSNAYKNANVYNMIAPRDPLSYGTIEQLIQDKFTILCRVIKCEVNMQYYHPKDLALVATPHEIHDANKRLVEASSEISQLKYSSSKQHNYRYIDAVYEHTRIHPAMKSLIETSLHSSAFLKLHDVEKCWKKEPRIKYLF